MPFTKVVEDWEIYNFAIHCLDHSCSKIWRYAQLKGPKWNWADAPGARSCADACGVATQAPRRPPVRHRTAHRDRPRSAGPRGVDPTHLRRTALLPLPGLATRPRRSARPVAVPPYWSALTHVAAAPPPTPRSVLAPSPWCARNTQPPRSSTIKAPVDGENPST
jgi:hypothetical protein